MTSVQIQHLDLTIRIPTASQTAMQKWLGDFTKEFPYLNVAPRLDESLLTINSQDLVEFTAYWDPLEISEFELEKILSSCRDQLSILEQKSISQTHRYHYQWCQAALKNLNVGRNRKNA